MNLYIRPIELPKQSAKLTNVYIFALWRQFTMFGWNVVLMSVAEVAKTFGQAPSSVFERGNQRESPKFTREFLYPSFLRLSTLNRY